MKTTEKRIVEWNEERGLIKTPKECDVTNNMAFVIEEVIESMTNMNSEEARDDSLVLSKVIRKGNLSKLIKYAKEQKLDQGEDEIKELDPEQVIDAAGDAIVFNVGTIRKMGYDPDLVMNEVLKVIESRKGSIIKGKFTKDKSPEAQALWYNANFNICKVN